MAKSHQAQHPHNFLRQYNGQGAAVPGAPPGQPPVINGQPAVQAQIPQIPQHQQHHVQHAGSVPPQQGQLITRPTQQQQQQQQGLVMGQGYPGQQVLFQQAGQQPRVVQVPPQYMMQQQPSYGMAPSGGNGGYLVESPDMYNNGLMEWREGEPVTPVSSCPISNIAREKEMFYDGEEEMPQPASVAPQPQQQFYFMNPPPPPKPPAPQHPEPPPPPIITHNVLHTMPSTSHSVQTSPAKHTPERRGRTGWQPNVGEGRRIVDILSV